MIVKGRMGWLEMLVSIRGSSLEDTWGRIAVATLIAVAVTFFELYFGVEAYTLTTTPFVLLGTAISIFLGFRNNTAYDRFWEARTLWGALVNVARTFARQALTLVGPRPAGAADGNGRAAGPDDQELTAVRRRMVMTTIAFVHALRHHLRSEDPFETLTGFLPAADLAALRGQRNVPMALVQRLGEQVSHAWRRGWIDPYHVPALDASLTEMTNIMGACERIKNTPIPFTYQVLLHRIVAFYCFFLPFGIVDSVRVFTPLVVFLISHALFGLDTIGEEVEEPFGHQSHALPLTALSRTIEVNLRQLLAEHDLPTLPVPENGVLM